MQCRVLLLLMLGLLTSVWVAAQPTLPDIAGSTDKGVVLLSWNCQYDGVRAVAVQHSTDSVYNYRIIGYVKKTGKGMQAFVDGHPDTGRNYYKLSIVFNSGLTWTSNKRMVYVDISKLGFSRLSLPRNDSLQRFIVTEELYKPGVVTVPGIDVKQDSDVLKLNGANVVGHKLSLSFDADSVANSGVPAGAPPPVVKRKITISFAETDMNDDLFIRSLYIFTDNASGHVKVELPDDVRKHHYSIKFYDKGQQMVLEIPKASVPKFIIDKRNFQRKGMFRFVLRKDDIVLETGYVRLDL